jgi:nicotinate-nucleotide adenylyltransferase
MRIGMLGGTFNPVHMGHLILAEEACQKLKLDKVIFVPTFLPPHKEIDCDIKPEDRLEMVRLAIEDNPLFEVSTFEIDLRRKSYSIDTIRKIKEIYGEKTELYFIAGSDSLKDLFSWKDINELFKLSKFIVANRPGYPFRDVPEEVETVVITPIEISSEGIRKRLAGSMSIRYLVPEKVWRYILEHKLYAPRVKPV